MLYIFFEKGLYFVFYIIKRKKIIFRYGKEEVFFEIILSFGRKI